VLLLGVPGQKPRLKIRGVFADQFFGMSQSLNRIRSLVSEIEQIQRQGQRSARPIRDSAPAPVSSIPETPVQASVQSTVQAPTAQAATPAPTPVPTPVASVTPIAHPAPVEESRVRVEWSGSVVLDLQFPNSTETLQLKRVGSMIEIRFSDGKAVHIPFKAVA